MKVDITADEQCIYAKIQGEIDHHNAKAIREEIDAHIQRLQSPKVVLDFSAVTFMDSSGIGLVMGRYRLVNAYGGKVEVAGTSSSIRRVMKMAGLEKLVCIQA